MKPVLEVNNIWKEYRIGATREKYVSIRESLLSAFKFNKSKDKNCFWALRDISFQLYPGESIGIIGANGAGKSTLLKVLSKITPPTKGSIVARGRVASLLEVGTGFHSELTGRENVYLNGSILGLKRWEIKSKFDEIVEFSGVEKFLDTPLKHYSSGMQLRLAFAVAANLEPEILVVDEVLAVGDAEFQKKCLGKMEQVSKGGRTILFVSHNMHAMQNLCDSAIHLSKGVLIEKGHVSSVVANYLSSLVTSRRSMIWEEEQYPGNESIQVHHVISNTYGKNENWEEGTSIIVEIKFEYVGKMCDLDITFLLENELGHTVFMASTTYGNSITKSSGGLYVYKAIIPEGLLIEGIYSISRLQFVQNRGVLLFELKNVIDFRLIPQKLQYLGWQGNKIGVVKPKITWIIEKE